MCVCMQEEVGHGMWDIVEFVCMCVCAGGGVVCVCVQEVVWHGMWDIVELVCICVHVQAGGGARHVHEA